MLKEFLDQNSGFPRSAGFSEVDLHKLSINLFSGFLDFLTNEEFPNKAINNLVRLTRTLMTEKLIGLRLDLQNEFLDSVFASCTENPATTKSVIVIPGNFTDIAGENPALELARLTGICSFARDSYKGLDTTDPKAVSRAEAFAAQAIIELSGIAIKEQLISPLTYEQGVILHRYPLGLASLKRGVNYPTPPFFPSVVYGRN